MTAQNLPVPFSYTQSLMASYKASRERLNSGRMEDKGLRSRTRLLLPCGMELPDFGTIAEQALAQWAERQKQILQEWVERQERIHAPVALAPIGPRPPRIPTIKRIIAKHYDVRLEDIDSVQRTLDITWPRQIMMYLSRQMTIHSLTEIGRRFGGRDHTTILHAIRKVSRRAMSDVTFAGELAELMIKIEKAGT